MSISDVCKGPKCVGDNSVIGACIGGVPWVGPIVNRTYQARAELPTRRAQPADREADASRVARRYANYTVFKNQTGGCIMLAMDPNDADHLIYSTSPAPSYQTFDGGKSWGMILGGMWHTGIGRNGWLFQAAMSGAFVCKDATLAGNKANWSTYYSQRTARRTNQTRNRAPHDYQAPTPARPRRSSSAAHASPPFPLHHPAPPPRRSASRSTLAGASPSRRTRGSSSRRTPTSPTSC
jgi:hypothetical protein